MKVSYKNNVLTVITDITEESIKKGIAALVAKDDKGVNELYRVSVSANGEGALGKNGMTVNTFVDGKAAVTIVTKMDTTQDVVEKTYGEALIAAAKYTGSIATAATEKEATIAGFFKETK